MMYERPEVASATATYWELLRRSLRAKGVAAPQSLSNHLPELEVWEAPDLVLSQTCGLPYRARLAERVTLIGTPDYGLPGCPPGYYNSVVVVRKDDTRRDLIDFADARFAYNQTLSQSGFAAIHALAESQGFWFSNRTASGSHRASARMVAESGADIAALDAQTWRFICRYDAFASRLRVLCETPPTPGLPYIAALGANKNATFEAVSEAIDALDPKTRQAIDLLALVPIPKSTYVALDIPPENASA